MSSPQRTPSEERERRSAAVSGMDKIKIAAADHMTIPVLPCAGLEPVLPSGGNIYTASSHFPMVPVFMTVPVSMTVYLCAASGEVTLFNALRVPEAVEDAILALGPVRHVVKLGQFHGSADAYYVRNPKFGSPRYWGATGMTTAEGLDFSDFLAPGSAPVAGSEVIVVEGMPYPECVILAPVPGRARALIVCDALSHISSYGLLPFTTRPVMWWLNFVCKDGSPVPPTLWLKTAVKLMGKGAVIEWFTKLFAMEWEAFACAHGSSIAECDRRGLGRALKNKIEKL